MAEIPKLVDPWLLAIWPGMGSVALTAGAFLTERLGAVPIGELPAVGFFEVEKVEIRKGVARMVSLPTCKFLAWKAPSRGRDLLFFLGESQPSHRGFEFCQQLLRAAGQFGVKRVFTFAAMATQLHPTAHPRVFAAVNDPRLLEELAPLEVQVLQEGHITGLNGIMLAAAHQQKLEAMCLLGEIPFFAVGVPNPRASLQVLEVFGQLSGVNVDLAALRQQATKMERGLVELMERMQETMEGMHGQGMQGMQSGDDEGAPGAGAASGTGTTAEEDPEREPPVNAEEQRRIEELFELARRDRTSALRLKNELDRLGVFKSYEDRFLDLFKQGE